MKKDNHMTKKCRANGRGRGGKCAKSQASNKRDSSADDSDEKKKKKKAKDKKKKKSKSKKKSKKKDKSKRARNRNGADSSDSSDSDSSDFSSSSSSDSCHVIRYSKISRFDGKLKAGKDAPRMKCQIQSSEGNKTCHFKHGLPDSGATMTLIGLDLAQKFKLSINENDRDHVLENASSERMAISGSAEIFLRAKGTGNPNKVITLISKDVNGDLLISYEDLVNLTVLSKSFPDGTMGEPNS